MINLVGRLFMALTAAALVAAVGYAAVIGDRAGADLFVVLAGAFAVVAAITVLAVQDLTPHVAADAPAPERRNAYTEADVPTGSAWPLVGAVAAVGVALGLAAGASWLAVALAASLIPVVGWLAHVWRDHPSFSAPVRERVVERLLAPIAMPVLGTLGALFIAVNISRVLLAVSTTASWVLALVLAVVLLAVLWLISARPRVGSSALVGLGVVAVLSMVVAGGIGARAGEREFHPHEDETPTRSITAKDTQFGPTELDFPANTDVKIHFRNRDEGVFHNVAFYTSTEPDRKPLFNGHPVTSGTVDYNTHTPAPGTYAFICDFHPTMTGTLVITPAGAPAASHEGAH